jgi:cellobiose phosphorylase
MAGAEKRVLEEQAYGEAFAWATAEIDRRLQAMGDKAVVIRRGAVVDSKFNADGEYFSGKVGVVNTDGSFDIEYDDGDKEGRLNDSAAHGYSSCLPGPWCKGGVCSSFEL